MISKERVILNFSKNIDTYNKYADIQRDMAEKLGAYVESSYAKKRVLEIGCGTGIFSEKIFEKFPYGDFIITDISREMVEYTKKRFLNGAKYLECDGENLPELGNFDYIVSNAVFQWFQNIETSIPSYNKNLNPDGKIIFSTFGERTYFEFAASLKNTGETKMFSQEFISKAKMEEIMSNGYKNVTIEEEFVIQEYESLREFLISIKRIGANSGNREKPILTKGLIDKIEDNYRKEFSNNNKLKATSHILYVVGCKKEEI